LIGDGDDDSGGSDGSEDVYNGKAEPMLVSVSDSYSDNDAISISDSRYSSYCCGNHLSQRTNDLTNE